MLLTNRLARMIVSTYYIKQSLDIWNGTRTAETFARWVWDHYGFSVAVIEYHQDRAELLYKNGTRCG